MQTGHRSLIAFSMLAAFLILADRAFAVNYGTSGQLSSPGTFCTTPRLVNSSYSVYGEADQYENKWTIWYSPQGTYPPNQRIYISKNTSYFPQQVFNYGGWFQTCVNNDTSGVTAVIFISEYVQ